MDTKRLFQHILKTYFTLRIGMAFLALAFPIVLGAGGHLRGVDFKGSMSAYYHTPMRDIFVGMLCAIGVFLFLYKGYSRAENIALNIAGVCAVGVALFPTDPTPAVEFGRFTAGYIHGVCSLTFFFSIAVVCIFLPAETLASIGDESLAEKYRRAYRLLGIAMTVLPIASAALLFLAGKDRHIVFVVELAAVWTFATYWYGKSREIKEARFESRMSISMEPLEKL